MNQKKNITRAKTRAHFVRTDGEKARRPFVGRYVAKVIQVCAITHED
jgi:hypothetical protein